jgi:N-acetylglutamate synthase-like GNAT family acetyltransferase
VRLTVRRLDDDVRAELARIGAEANGSRPVELDEAVDGFLMSADGDPACWCCAAPNGTPDSLVLSGFRVAPIYRHRHFALKLLEGVLEDLRTQGVHHVDVSAERGESL